MSHAHKHTHTRIPQIWSMFNLTTGHNWNCGKINYSNVIVLRYGFGPFWLMMIMSRKIVWLCHLVGWKCCTSKQKRVDCCCCWRQLSYSQYTKRTKTHFKIIFLSNTKEKLKFTTIAIENSCAQPTDIELTMEIYMLNLCVTNLTEIHFPQNIPIVISKTTWQKPPMNKIILPKFHSNANENLNFVFIFQFVQREGVANTQRNERKNMQID